MLLDGDLNAAIELRDVAAEYANNLIKSGISREEITASMALFLYQLKFEKDHIDKFMTLYAISDLVDACVVSIKKNCDKKAMDQVALDLGILNTSHAGLHRQSLLINALSSISSSMQWVEVLNNIQEHLIEKTTSLSKISKVINFNQKMLSNISQKYANQFKECQSKIGLKNKNAYRDAIGTLGEYKMINKLKAYIKKIDPSGTDENINFEAGFSVMSKSRAKSREANYELAKALLQDLTNGKSIQEVFSNKTAIEERRQAALGEQKFKQLSFFGKKTIRGGLRDILVEAEKITGVQLK